MLLNHSLFRILIFIIGFTAIVADIFNSYAYFILKPACTSTIIAYSLSYRNITLKKYPLQISIGLFFCLLGDIFLLLETFFIYGLVSFLIAHLIFLFAFIKRQGWQWRPKIVLVLLPIAAAIFIFISKDLGHLMHPCNDLSNRYFTYELARVGNDFKSKIKTAPLFGLGCFTFFIF